MATKVTPLKLLRIFFYSKRFRPFLYLYLVIVSVIFIALFFNYFAVRTVIIESKNPRTVYGIDVFHGKNLPLLNSASVLKKLKTLNPEIQSIDLEKIYPNTIMLSVEFTQPVALIKTTDSFLPLSINGVVLKKSGPLASYTVPEIIYYQPLSTHEYPEGAAVSFTDIQTTLKVVGGLKDLGIPIKRVEVRSFSMIVCYTDKEEYVITAEKDAQEQLETLKLVIIKSKTTGEQFKSLDVRFQKPVIVY